MSTDFSGDLIIKAERRETDGKYLKAIELYEEAQKQTDKTSGVESDLAHLDDILGGLASCKFELGLYPDATIYYSRLLKLRQQRSDDESELAQTRYDLAQSLVRQQEYGKAVPLYRQYLATKFKEHEKDREAKFDGRHSLAYALSRRFEFSEAAKLNQENVNFLEGQGIASSDIRVCKSRYQLGNDLYYLQDFEKALAWAKTNISAMDLSKDEKLQGLCKKSKQLAAACQRKLLAQSPKTRPKLQRIKPPSDKMAEKPAITTPATASVVSSKRFQGSDKAKRVPQPIISSNPEAACLSNKPTPALLKDIDGTVLKPVSKLSLPKNDSLGKPGSSSLPLSQAPISTRSEPERPKGLEAPLDVKGNSRKRACNGSVTKPVSKLSLPKNDPLDKPGSSSLPLSQAPTPTRSEPEQPRGQEASLDVKGNSRKRASDGSMSMSPNKKTLGSYYTSPGTQSSHLDAKLADAWFQNYMTSTLAIFADATRDGQDRRYIRPKTDKVRIAILDSGVKIKHPDIKPQSRRLQTKSFVGGHGSGIFSSKDDLDGHGTHSTLLMLGMVPHAEIYVARVGGEKGVGPEPKDVAEAIDWAHKNWHVDIISMAFGYSAISRDMSKFLEMERAIRDAHRNDVLFFAATSNHGAQRGTAFPASMNEVICINSTNGGGVQSSFNPQTVHADRVFSVLGEQVKPPVLERQTTSNENQLDNSRMSGTSTAVTIAAGVAGLVLYLANTSKSLVEGRVQAVKTRAKSMEGMCLILRWLSSKRDERENGGEWIVPWHKLDCLNANNYSENMPGRELVRTEVLEDLAKYLRPMMPGVP